MAKAQAVTKTEAQLIAMLRKRLTRAGNGGAGEYAFMVQVRNGAGFNSTRTFDAVAMNLWPSRGLELHAYEIKSRRNDWLRELKEPEKAEDAAKLVDRFSVVAGSADIVRDGELPAPWGLLVARGEQLVQIKEARLLRDIADGPPAHRPIPRDFVVSMLRSDGHVPLASAEEVRLARSESFQEGVDSQKVVLERCQSQLAELRKQIRDFERESGLSFHAWAADRDPAAIGRAVRAMMEGEDRVKIARRRMVTARDDLRAAADSLDGFIGEE